MTSPAFTFKLTVPRDPALAAVVTDLAAHAAAYAGMNEATGAAFVTRVATASSAELAAVASDQKAGCVVVIAGSDNELRCTIGGQAVSQKISV